MVLPLLHRLDLLVSVDCTRRPVQYRRGQVRLTNSKFLSYRYPRLPFIQQRPTYRARFVDHSRYSTSEKFSQPTEAPPYPPSIRVVAT